MVGKVTYLSSASDLCAFDSQLLTYKDLSVVVLTRKMAARRGTYRLWSLRVVVEKETC